MRIAGVPSLRFMLRLPVRGPNFPLETERVKRGEAAIVDCPREVIYSTEVRTIARRIGPSIAD